MIGDGEAETGALATSWHSNKLLSPRTDGAVLPILHLNGYKIANPTLLARIPEDELTALLSGYGYRPILVSGGLEAASRRRRSTIASRQRSTRRSAEIAEIQRAARYGGAGGRPRWPMIVLRTPKGWTGPKEVDGVPVEGTWRAHQVPLAERAGEPRPPAPAGRVDAQLPTARSCSTSGGRRSRSWPSWRRGESGG